MTGYAERAHRQAIRLRKRASGRGRRGDGAEAVAMINWLTAALAGRQSRPQDMPRPEAEPETELRAVIRRLDLLYYDSDGPFYMNRQLGEAIGYLAACKPASGRGEAG